MLISSIICEYSFCNSRNFEILLLLYIIKHVRPTTTFALKATESRQMR